MDRGPFLILVVFLAVLSAAAPVRAENFAVVANTQWPGDTITGAELKALYLGQRPFGADRKPVTITTDSRSPIHHEFLMNVVGMTPRQYVTYWKRMVFTGAGLAPINLRGEDAVKSFVSNTPGAIGYVSNSDPGSGSLKVLEVIP